MSRIVSVNNDSRLKLLRAFAPHNTTNAICRPFLHHQSRVYRCIFRHQISPTAHVASLCNTSLFSKLLFSKHAILAGVVGLAPGTFHTVLVRQDGSVWSTGVNSDAQNESFIKVISKDAMAAATGNYYSIVLKQDGSVLITGKNLRGHISFFAGSAISRRKFSVVKKILDVKAVAAGGYHSMVVMRSGHVWCTGWNQYGQLGDGSTCDRVRFTSVMRHEAEAVAAGDTHSIVLKQDGSVWATGRNLNGQLGDGTKADRNRFVQVMSSGAGDLAAGGYHSIVLKEDGSVYIIIERIWPAG